MEGLSSPLPLREGDKDPYTVTTVYPKNAIAFFDKRNPLMKTFRGRLWPNTASKLAVQILTYLKQYAPFCPTSFSLSLAQILRLPRKIKTKCIFRVETLAILQTCDLPATLRYWPIFTPHRILPPSPSLRGVKGGGSSPKMSAGPDWIF